MNFSELWQLGLTISAIVYGIYTHFTVHKLKKELNKPDITAFTIRVQIDRTGKTEPVLTLYQEGQKIDKSYIQARLREKENEN